MSYKLWKRGREVPLGKPWREGGEAKVYRSPNDKYLFKVYHHPTPETAERLRHLIDNPPSHLAHGFVEEAWAWPLDGIIDNQGRMVGYVMRRIDGAWPLTLLFHREARLKFLPGLNTRHLAQVSANLFAVLDATHGQGIVLGDCSPNNVLFNPHGGCTVIDLDSAQLTTPQKLYRCYVATPEYLCPSLGKLDDFSSQPREPHHDVFSAAAVAYQVLSGGRHFCEGVAQPRRGELPPPLARRVTIGAWPFTTRNKPAMRVAPLKDTLGFEAFGPALGGLFRRAFDDGFDDPRRRPAAAEFRDELRRFAGELGPCPQSSRHFFHHTLQRCPWCAVAKRAGADPFPTQP
jgi:DNA-binding helix-hairpin-helix protein with protein kinase domain